MDPINFLPYLAQWLGVAPSTILFWLGFITFAANTAARLIPETATGTLGVVRKICSIVGVYVSNRVAPGVTQSDVSKAALSFPEVAAKVAAPDAPLAPPTSGATVP